MINGSEMRLSGVYLSKYVSGGFILAFAIVISSGFYTYLTTQDLINTAEKLTDAYRVSAISNQILALTVDIETAQRGFVITGDSSYLGPYFVAKDTIDYFIKSLQQLDPANAPLIELSDTLHRLIKLKQQFVEHVIQARSISEEMANQYVITGFGKDVMNLIRKQIYSLQEGQHGFFQQSKLIWNERLKQFQIAFITLSVVIACVIGLLFYFINNALKIRNATEAKLKEALQGVRMLYDNAPCGYLSVGPDIRITNINTTLLKWLGYSSSEVVGNFKYEDLLSEASKEQFLSTFERDFEEYKTKGFVQGLEFEFKRKDGSVFPVLVNSSAIFDHQGNFYKSTTTVFDISDRKRLELRFKSLIESSPDALIIVNDEGKIQLANEQSELLFGYSRSEMIGNKVEMLIPEELRANHVAQRMQYTSRPVRRPMGLGIELKAQKKNGQLVPVEISLSPIETDEGMLIIGAIRDVTERNKQEQHIRQLNAELEAFTYSVSHDLRAPLRSINGYTEILDQEYASRLDDEGKRILATVTRNAKRMGHLIDDLLDFSRIGRQELKKAKVDMNQIVRTIADEFIIHENGRRIELGIDDLGSAYADVSMIKQVWINLLSNALKYTSKNEVTIIRINRQESLTEIQYSISDNGVGFDDRYKHKLFEVFQRLHSTQEFEGTGVGLALVKRIITRHGGTAWAFGKVDNGATFAFSLPKT